LIPVNLKTLGDHLLLKRIATNLSQSEVAVKTGVSEQTIRAWEHDQLLPTETQWQVLAGILRLDSTFPKS
jgi:transcriptional regulator with XRE-family HTH domain